MDRLVYLIYKAVQGLLGFLSLPTIFNIGRSIGVFGYYVAGPYRKLALRNLEIAFGSETDEAQRKEVTREHFANLVANLLCSLRIAQMQPEEVLAIVEVESKQLTDRLFAEGKGILFAISHLGNWELLAQIMPILYADKPRGTVYQRLGNPYIEEETRHNRSTRGMQLFERKEGFGGALKTLRAGGMVGVLIDQHAGDAGLWCPFFKRLASTSSLAATLAVRAGSPMVPMSIVTIAPGRWKLTAMEPVQCEPLTVENLTVAANLALEAQIRVNPADWFWVHNRWKLPKPKFLLSTYKRGIVESVAAGTSGAAALQPFRVVVRSSNWLGDAIMSVPAVRAIKRGRPDLQLTILTPAKLADVWRHLPEVDEVIEITERDSLFDVARMLKRDSFEVAVLFPNSLRVALEAWLAGIPRRVGYPGHNRVRLINQAFREKKSKKKVERKDEHQVHHYLRLAEFIGADISDPALQEFPKRGEPGERARIGLCPGAEYGPAKRWLPERFAEVVVGISDSHAVDWRIFGVSKDQPIGEEIERLAPGLCQNRIGQTSLAQLIEELQSCDLLVTNDTGTMHLAAFLGVPTVAIFGSTEPVLTRPLGSNHRILRHHVPCSPCFLRECPIDFRCMNRITSEQVIAAVRETLQQYRTDRVPTVS